MRPEYVALYRDLQERHWWWRAREAAILRELDRIRPTVGWDRVLEVGCGGGALFDALLERANEVEGVEPDADLVDPEGPHARRIHLRTFDASFPVPDRPFALVLMLDVLEHLDRRVEALAHVRRLLRPGGLLLITVPALPLLWTRHDELNHHRLRYTRKSLSKEARSAGFEIRTLRYFFHWTVAGKLVQRTLEAVTAGKPVPPRIPPGPINWILKGMSELEHAATRTLHVPFGSSLMMVAEAPTG